VSAPFSLQKSFPGDEASVYNSARVAPPAYLSGPPSTDGKNPHSPPGRICPAPASVRERPLRQTPKNFLAGLGSQFANAPAPPTFPHNNFRPFSLSFQSSFHLSLSVLFRYRFWILYLGLSRNYATLGSPLPRTATLLALDASPRACLHRAFTFYGITFQ
jgi:hypothetical protein